MTYSWLRLGGFALVGGCTLPAAFPCVQDSDCVDGERPGQCQPEGWCSFPNDRCGSGQRYGTHAGDGLAGACVDEPGSTGAIETSTGALDGSDPSLASLEATGAVDDGGDTSTSRATDTSSGTTAITTTPVSDDAGMEGGHDGTDEAGGSSGSGPSVPVCGDGTINGMEACDGFDLGVEDCSSLGAGVGAPMCNDECQYDLSSCIPDDGGDYAPCDMDPECPAMVCQLFAGNGTCLPPCQNNDACPLQPGAQDPVCTADAFCVLPCSDASECPDGMRCDDSAYGLVCLW
jgi:hypothetical protein